MSDDVRLASWLLLLHQIPAKPDYLRVKIWRRMQRIGAIPLKNAAWVLPVSETGREDFEWLIREIEGEGGEAILCDVRFMAGLSAAQVNALSRLIAARADANPTVVDRSRFDTVEPGSVWVTRKNVFVDRMASAWLIRRHIDPHAQFKFVEDSYEPTTREIRFDMYGGEFTHVGDACTFEVLASTFVPDDSVVARIAEVVHDIDMKDQRHGHADAVGLEVALSGLCATTQDDAERIAKGADLFDWWYAAHSAIPPLPPSRT